MTLIDEFEKLNVSCSAVENLAKDFRHNVLPASRVWRGTPPATLWMLVSSLLPPSGRYVIVFHNSVTNRNMEGEFLPVKCLDYDFRHEGQVYHLFAKNVACYWC